MTTSMEFIREFNLEAIGLIKEAYITPTTETVSQTFGGLMSKREEMLNKMPDYLYGCVDAIYTECLNHLHKVALFQRDLGKVTNDELTKAILDEEVRIRGVMRQRRNLPKEEKGCSCGKKGSCQSPIMEA